MDEGSSRLGHFLRMVLATATAVATVLLPSGGSTAILTAAGDLDPAFGIGGQVTTVFGGTSSAGALALQPDGKLVAAGESDRNFGIVRYLTDGSLDGTFGAGGMVITDFGTGAFDRVNALVQQPDGKLVAAGGNPGSAGTGPLDFLLARYNPDGGLDVTFGTGGKVTTDFTFGSFDRAHALVLQPDGRLVAAGHGNPGGRVSGFVLARYNADGSLDDTFGSSGRVLTGFVGVHSFANALVLQPDSKLVAAGSGGGFALARYLPGEAACVVDTLAALPNPELAKSSSLPSSAASGSRGAGRKRLDPAAFRRLRDLVLGRSPGGRRYAALYAAHSPEVVRSMLVDPALRAAILDGLLLWQSNVAALAAGRGAVMTVTADQARAVDAVVEQLAKAGSPRLRRAIERDRRAHPPGLNFAQAVLREIAR